MPTLRDYLHNSVEPLPEWLTTYVPGDVRDGAHGLVRNLLSGRVVFYPGCGNDGAPVCAFNITHAAHAFLYVDYLLEPEARMKELDDPETRFKGYRTLDRIHIIVSDLAITEWPIHDGADNRIPPRILHRPRGFIEILERDYDLDDNHGASRFAVMFLTSDGFAAFDALYCRQNSFPPPFCIVVQDHGLGGNYGRWHRGGMLERLSVKGDVRPQFLLVANNSKLWKYYRRSKCNPEYMAGNMRSLYKRVNHRHRT